MAKKKFEYMSTNEWMGDSTTHFMKSGEVFRSDDNDQLHELAKLIPKEANGVKVEYDITYDAPHIAGYKYTDFLTKAIYLAPNSFKISRNNISEVAGWDSTDEGLEVADKLRESICDKYFLDNDDEEYECDELVVLPGTNILIREGAIDMEKIDGLVTNGAKVKLHPITSRVWRNLLANRWGRDNVIPADAPLYPILRGCKKVHFPMSSETGISSTLLGKQIGIITGPKPTICNFEFIYRGLDGCNASKRLIDKLTALLSHPESGIITVFHRDPEKRINQYFEHMRKYHK